MLHPLDHSLFTCHGYPGGFRAHASFVWQVRIRSAFRHMICCPIAHHEFVVVIDAAQVKVRGVTCIHCGAEPTRAEHNQAVVNARQLVETSNISDFPPVSDWGDL